MKAKANKTGGTWDVASVFDFLVVAEKLKTVKRDLVKSDGEFESSADHSWMMGLMAILFEPKLKNKVDMARVMELVVVHDLVEAVAGDVPLREQMSDSGAKKKKIETEQMAIEKMRAMLPEELGDEICELWQEYEELKTPEAKYVRALDKLEAIVQNLMLEDIGYYKRHGCEVYYDVVLKDMKKVCWEHEEELVIFGEKLKTVMRDKLVIAGLEEGDENKSKNGKI